MKREGIKESKQTQWICNPSSPRLLTIKKAATVLGLSTWGMRERVWQGQIPVVKFDGGRKQYIDVQDLENFIQTHKTTVI
jgi:hypothetical protein